MKSGSDISDSRGSNDQETPGLPGSIGREIFFGPFQLIPSRRILMCGGKQVRLGEPAYNVLLALIERAGETVERETLIARAWGTTYIEESNLRTAVAALRRALKDAGSARSYITTVAREGYRFVEPVVLGVAGTSQPSAQMQLSKIVGRDVFITDLVEEISGYRLVTVVGPGGIGKTTTAQFAARRALDENRFDSVSVVGLDATEDPDILPSVFRAGLGIIANSNNPMADIEAFLGNRRTLIILDSCERMIDAIARLIETVLTFAPNTVILATSREPLRARGERIRRLDPLLVPPANKPLSASEALSYASVELFVDRANSSCSNFQLTDETASIVGEICMRLDGVPLAIEVAAARIDSFDLSVLAHVLDGHFRLQMVGRSTALPRHRTLAATFDWSFDALTEQEQIVFRRLSVFRGHFSFDAARYIIGCHGIESADIGGLIANLVAKSLVTRGNGQAQGRHRLLDTTRAYAKEKLNKSGESDLTLRRHATYYEAVLTAAAARTDLVWWADWERAYGLELDQIRAALEQASSPSGDPQSAMKLTHGALPLWGHLGLERESEGWVDRVKALPGIQPSPDQFLAWEEARAGAWGFRDHTSADAIESWPKTPSFERRAEASRRKMQVLFTQFGSSYASGRFRDCLSLGQRMREAAKESSEAGAAGIGDRAVGCAFFYLGDTAASRTANECALSHGGALSRCGFDTHTAFDERIGASSNLAKVLMLQGFPKQALERTAENVDRALATGHSGTICVALGLAACQIGLDCGDLGTAEHYVDVFHRYVGPRPALGLWHRVADMFGGALLIRRGEYDAAIVTLRTAVKHLRAAQMWSYYTAGLGYLSSVLIEKKQFIEASEIINEALERCERAEEMWCYPHFLTIKANILIKGKLGDASQAESCLNRAMNLSEEQGSRFWQAGILSSRQLIGTACLQTA